MTPTLRRLHDALSQGLCLHGSQTPRLTILEPRQAVCPSGIGNRCLTAVYADTDIVRPLFHACLTKQCCELKGDAPRYRQSESGAYQLRRSNTTLTFGSVYVVPSDTFHWQGDEFISLSPVSVIEEIVVSPATLLAISSTRGLNLNVPPPWR